MIETIKNYLTTMVDRYNLTQQPTPCEINQIVNGSYAVSHVVIDKSIKVNGQAILGDAVLVKEKLVVNGSLVAKQVDFESSVEVSGTASLVNSRIKDKAIFSGTLDAQNVIFSGSVELLANKSEFDHCQIDNLKVQSLPFKNSVQTIWLTNETILTGDILFQSGIGKVYIDASSVINGRIIGGTLIQH